MKERQKRVPAAGVYTTLSFIVLSSCDADILTKRFIIVRAIKLTVEIIECDRSIPDLNLTRMIHHWRAKGHFLHYDTTTARLLLFLGRNARPRTKRSVVSRFLHDCN